MQSDTCVRALWGDPAVGFIPPFIVILPQGGPDTGSLFFLGYPRAAHEISAGKARVIWTHPHHRLPLHLVDTFPQGCGSAGCPDIDCGMFDMSKSRTLHEDNFLLRKQPYPPALLCNSWGCNKDTLKGDKLVRCAKCQVVRYCKKEHQV